MKVERDPLETSRNSVPVLPHNTPYIHFVNHFLRPLKPCLISGLSNDWNATKHWTTTDVRTGSLIPNFSALQVAFRDSQGCVTLCDVLGDDGNFQQKEMTVSQFIENVLSNSNRNFFKSTQKTYLKDFHFMLSNNSLKDVYDVPYFFQGRHPRKGS